MQAFFFFFVFPQYQEYLTIKENPQLAVQKLENKHSFPQESSHIQQRFPFLKQKVEGETVLKEFDGQKPWKKVSRIKRTDELYLCSKGLFRGQCRESGRTRTFFQENYILKVCWDAGSHSKGLEQGFLRLQGKGDEKLTS